ncbi:NAD+ synthase [archaeon]|nr:MAG: NAD+ synthase [archaeon]
MPMMGERELKGTIASLRERIKGFVASADAAGVVIGVSGGIDSAVVATLCAPCVDTLALIMPAGDQSSPQDTQDAVDLCTELGIQHAVIDIGGVVKAVEDNYTRQETISQMALGNVKARVRMTYLYLCANMEKRLVVGTSNRSEWLIGYSTKWGDSAADLYPIGALWKSEVYWLGSALGIPDAIMEKPPSAGLYPGQTDEAELGASYDAIDKILSLIVDERMSPTQAGKTVGNEPLARSLYKRMTNTAHKRVMPRSLEVSR